MTPSRLTDEEFTALDEACWDALGGRCSCASGAPPCARDKAQQDLLAWAMGNVFEDSGQVMIEVWKASREFRREFPYLFRAKWGE